LTDGQLARGQVRFDEAAHWLVVERPPITMAYNFAPQRRRVPLRSDMPHDLLLASQPDVRVDRDSVQLPPHSVALFGPEELSQFVREPAYPVARRAPELKDERFPES
jgi:hypothetical protein